MAAGMFDRLTEKEKTAAPAIANEQEDDGWESISPPATAQQPPTFKGDSTLGSVGGVWEYRDHDGVVEGYVVRFDNKANGDATKTFRPCRYGRLNGKVGWQWHGWGDGRPLFNLPDVLSRNTAPVLICEGEKAACEAAKLFPDCVTTTPMNGAQSPAKTDWEPVRGRTVTIWPDHDDSGRSFATHVAQLCNAAGAASVHVVAVPESFPEKWDLGDPAPNDCDPAKLRGLLDGAVLHQPGLIAADSFTVSPSSAWLSPDMSILTEGRVPPPELPLALFGSWTSWIETAAEVKNCPADFVTVSLIAIAATLIGNARRGMPWSGWTEPCILWSICVGPPSSGKSPGQDSVLEPLRKIEIEFAASYAETLRKHKGAVVVAKENCADWEGAVKEAVKAGTPPPDMPEDAVEPERPRRPRIVVTDSSIEEMANLLQQNPHGLGFHRDELSGWLANFERRGGSDRPFWVEAFGGRPYPVDRVKHDEPIIVPFLSVSIIGGVQPDLLAKFLTSGDDDGLASRFLFVWPENVPFARPKRTLNAQWAQTALGKLHGLAMAQDEQGNPTPVLVPFSNEAAHKLAAWRAGQSTREAGVSGLLLSHVGKLPGIVVRLSLVLTFLEWAATPNGPEPTEIPKRHALAAIGLVDAYFLPMAKRCFGDAALPQELRDAAAVGKWIIRPLDVEKGEQRPTIINARELRHGEGAPLRDSARMRAALAELEDLGWVKSAGGREGGAPGRQRSDYAVNPKVFKAVETGT